MKAQSLILGSLSHTMLGKMGLSESETLRDTERVPEEDDSSSYLFILGPAAIG